MRNQILVLFLLLTISEQIFANIPCILNVYKNVATTKNFSKNKCNYSNSQLCKLNYFTPKIHNVPYPYFCINHLLIDPDHCSSWTGSDNDGKKYLEFITGSAGAYFDPNLLSRISSYLHLIPKSKTWSKQHCDYVHCRKCGEVVVHAYGRIETNEEDEDGNTIYERKILYKCACCKFWWWIDIDDYDDEDITSNWFWCKEPGIYPGYVDWHHQTYFHHLESFLHYCSENSKCSCYWPQVSKEACDISNEIYNSLFAMAEQLKESTPLFNEYLIHRTTHGFLRALLRKCVGKRLRIEI